MEIDFSSLITMLFNRKLRNVGAVVKKQPLQVFCSSEETLPTRTSSLAYLREVWLKGSLKKTQQPLTTTEA